MYENKNIIILGFARSGYGCAKLLSKNNNVILVDMKSEDKHDKNQIEELKSLGVRLEFGNQDESLLTKDIDYLIKNPGIRNDVPFVKKAEELGICVTNEVEVAYNMIKDKVSIIGIIGTNGKTTTTTVTYNIMKEYYGDRVHLVGNIGFPMTSIVDKVKDNDIVVMEVSCQQSVNIKDFHPHVGLLTNLFPAHIDFFGSFELYKKTKAKMFYNQSDDDIAIMNLENPDSLEELENIKSTKKYFSSKKKTDCYLENNSIYYNSEKVIDTDIIKIPGVHNIENIMAAISIVKEYDVPNTVIEKVVGEFKGVEHRLEYVDTVNGVRFYNDTEATNIKCTQIALGSFNKPTIIILGGLERGQDFNELHDYMDHVKAIIAIGSCRNRVVEFANNEHIPVYEFEFLKNSFKTISKIMESGDIVLLSPASASWDQYKECEVRGKEFKDLVKEIK